MNLRPVLLLLFVSACSHKADIVVTNGLVWTGLSTGRGQLGAVAMRDGKLLAVGDSAEIARHIRSKTKVLDAHGGVGMPGSVDEVRVSIGESRHHQPTTRAQTLGF